MSIVLRLPKLDDTPSFIVKTANSGALRAIEALEQHLAVPKAMQYGILGAGAGGVGGFMSADDGSRLNGALLGALLGGAGGAGLGYMGGRGKAVEKLQELSTPLKGRLDEFASPSLASLKREATALQPHDQKALRDAVSREIKSAEPQAILPSLDDAFSLGGASSIGLGGLAGYGHSALGGKKERGYGGGFQPGYPPPPRFMPPPRMPPYPGGGYGY